MKAGRCFVQTVGVLVLFTVARTFGLLGPPAVAAGLLIAALVLVAWDGGAHTRRPRAWLEQVPAGLRYGAAAFGMVLLVLVMAALIPATNGFLHDSRAQISGGRLLYELGVSIVLLTAIPEEFAFRGVLLGSALRLWGPWRASLITSVLFGLWHIAPTLHTMSDNHVFRARPAAWRAGAAGAGRDRGDVRRGSRLLLAQAAIPEPDRPGLAHVATNGLALTVAGSRSLAPRPAMLTAITGPRDDLPEVGQVLGGDAGGPHDGVPPVDVLGRSTCDRARPERRWRTEDRR